MALPFFRTRPILMAAMLAALALLAIHPVRWLETRRWESQVRRLQQQKEQLLAYAQRLSASRRVAQVDVVARGDDDQHRQIFSLVWREVAEDGTIGPSAELGVIGHLVYFEAAVIKFDRKLSPETISEPRPSVALFRRVFGDEQSPAEVADLDRSGPLSRPNSSTGDPSEAELWALFWQFIDDPQLAHSFGVRVAQIEAPAVPLRTGDVWEVTLDATGGLNLRKLGTRDATGGVAKGPVDRTLDFRRP